LMKRNTVVVYNLRICMRGDNLCVKNMKGDNSWVIIICSGWGVLCDLTHSSDLLNLQSV